MPSQDDVCDYLFLNGKKVSQEVEIKMNDRIVIGTNSAFVVKLPGELPRSGTPDEIDWEFT